MKRQDYTINGDFIVKSQQQAEILSAVKDIKKKGEMNKVDPKDCSPDCVCENMCGCDGKAHKPRPAGQCQARSQVIGCRRYGRVGSDPP